MKFLLSALGSIALSTVIVNGIPITTSPSSEIPLLRVNTFNDLTYHLERKNEPDSPSTKLSNGISPYSSPFQVHVMPNHQDFLESGPEEYIPSSYLMSHKLGKRRDLSSSNSLHRQNRGSENVESKFWFF